MDVFIYVAIYHDNCGGELHYHDVRISVLSHNLSRSYIQSYADPKLSILSITLPCAVTLEVYTH